MKYEDIRRQVLTAIRQASAQGLIHGTSGNISVRDREAGVAAVPGSCFGLPGYLRLSCCCSQEDLSEGLDRWALRALL